MNPGVYPLVCYKVMSSVSKEVILIGEGCTNLTTVCLGRYKTVVIERDRRA